MEQQKYQVRLPSPSEISELVTDSDPNEVLDDHQRQALEQDLEKLVESIYNEYGNNSDSRSIFNHKAKMMGLYQHNIKLNI